MKKSDTLTAAKFLAPYLLFCSVFLVGPLFYGLWISLHKWQLLGEQPRFVGIDNYAHALQDDLFWVAVARTGFFILLTVPLSNLISLMIASGLSQTIRSAAVLRAMFYLPCILSVSVVALLWRWMYASQGGLINQTLHIDLPWLSSASLALPSIALLSIWWGMGGNMLIYLAAIKGVPKEFFEAAELDGANRIRMFTSVTLPGIKPALLFGVVISMVGASQVFGQIYILTNGSGGPAYSTLSLVLYMYQQGFSNYQLGYGSAIAYLLFALIVMVSWVQLRLVKAESAQ